MNSDQNESINLPLSNGFILVETMNIIRCEADGIYTTIYLSNSHKYMVTKNLKTWQTALGDDFIRVHGSHLVNKHCIERYVKGKSHFVIMKDKSQVPVSRRRKHFFLETMKGTKV